MKSVFQEELTVLNLKSWIYENHICELWGEELYEGRSSQLYTQLLQMRKESLNFPSLLTAVENQNWHWPGPARCDRLLIINKLFRDNVATERATSSSQG